MSEHFSNGHAVIIGVGGDLRHTVNDAKGLADILRDPERCGYLRSQVHELTSQDANRNAILGSLQQLARNATPESTVIIYFSGHGYQVETAIGKDFYLLPFDYDLNELNKSAISGDEFSQHLGAIEARKMLVLLDCCHAGEIDMTKAPGLKLTKSPLPPETNELFTQGSGRVMIASSKAHEKSFAGRPYSAFTLALIEALAGRGNSEQDGFVRVADLALHAREMVPKRTRDRQHPILKFDKADNFVVAYYAGGEAQAKDLPFVEEPEIEPEPGVFRFEEIGDKVGGDKIQTGNVSGMGIAIGRHAQANVVLGNSYVDLDPLFDPLMNFVHSTPLAQKDEAIQIIHALKREVTKGKSADDTRIATLLEHLITVAPDTKNTVRSTFSDPILSRLTGPVTKFALRKLEDR